MIISYDIENYKKNKEGVYEPHLDATGKYFTLGVVYKETGGHKVFTDRKEMWNYIIELGHKEMKRGKRLICYAHNSKYDFYQIADLNNRALRWFSENPFIAGYYVKDESGRYKEIIKFLDSMSLFHMSLKKLGDIIGFPKKEIPIEIGTKLTKGKIKEIAKYCANDCKVILEGIKFLKKKLKDDGLCIKNLCTINQIAISYIINKLRKGNNEHILYPSKNGGLSEYTWKTKFADEIHSAYRGGFVRVWKTGEIKGVSNIDCNSLYPYSATIIDFPDLRTERKIEKPLEIMDLEQLMSKIGISRVMIKNNSNKLGLLQIRGMNKAYVPLDEKILIGTWTHIELREAIKQGYEIVGIEWSIIWDSGMNPFGDIFRDIYNKRIEDEDEFNKYFYKQILNGSIGKFGQTRRNQEILIDSVEKVYEYLQRNYEIIKGIEGKTDVMYINKDVNVGDVKKYYAPIIPTLITAQARVLMYRAYNKIPLNELCYTDTDSILMTGDNLKKFKIGNNMGEFKIEKDSETNEELINTNALIWGTKSKCIGNNIALSGVYRSDLNMEDFRKGKIKARIMLGMRNTRNDEIGKFVIEERDLKKQLKEFTESEELMQKEKIYIDKNIEDLTFFVDYLGRLDVPHPTN